MFPDLTNINTEHYNKILQVIRLEIIEFFKTLLLKRPIS